jgi:hypothetical protein
MSDKRFFPIQHFFDKQKAAGGTINPLGPGLAIPKIDKIIFRDRVTLVFWADGMMTRSTRALEDNTFDPLIGIGQCLLKKAFRKKYILRMIKKADKQGTSPAMIATFFQRLKDQEDEKQRRLEVKKRKSKK